MALFQRSLYGEDPTFANLFRMLNDFDACAREVQPHVGHRRGTKLASFNPRFDVRETETTYELYGEIPGVDRKDVSIEFTEPQTMTIHGRVERNYTAGTPPAATEEKETSGAIEEKEDTASHQASVSDEETETAKESGVETPSVATPAETPRTENAAPVKPKERFWHQERSVGEFHRAFTFASRVDDSAVSASLNNGILHVSVPKAVKRETRRINIE
jgi:HSP20 family molecular chaperone IbpA